MASLAQSQMTHQDRAAHARTHIRSHAANQPSVLDVHGKLPGENPLFSGDELRLLKARLEDDHLDFTRYMFKHREGSKFQVSRHHRIIAKTLDKVISGDIKRLIINIPPGYTKTEMAVIHFIARGMAIQPASKFIHVSYSDQLAMLNSTVIKDVVLSEEFQQLWPFHLRSDSKSKKAWGTSLGGAMLAVSSGGAITGFRAGRMMTGFSGALIIDDPLKPDDAYSQITRDKVNNRFTNTFKSRLAHEDIPIIVIMQRIHEDDPTGFLLKGGTGDFWHHLELPATVLDTPAKYPVEFTHGIPIEHGLEAGALWPYKHTLEQLEVMAKSDPYTHASQYEQRPAPLGGGIFKADWWEYYETVAPPLFDYRIITGDTAQKTKEHNDYSVFQLWGVHAGKAYLIDQIRGKWEAPDLKIQCVAFWNKHKDNGLKKFGNLRCLYVEDKVSGTGLIQDIKKDEKTPIPVKAVQRNTDKITRAMDAAPYIASGYVYLPKGADFLSEYMSEFAKFTPTMSHAHDDQIDPTLDAIEILLRPTPKKAGFF